MHVHVHNVALNVRYIKNLLIELKSLRFVILFHRFKISSAGNFFLLRFCNKKLNAESQSNINLDVTTKVTNEINKNSFFFKYVKCLLCITFVT